MLSQLFTGAVLCFTAAAAMHVDLHGVGGEEEREEGEEKGNVRDGSRGEGGEREGG